MDLETGMPTNKSLNAVLKGISDTAGRGEPIIGAYIKNDNFAEMDSFARYWESRNNDLTRPAYNLLIRQCMTFTRDVIEAGGVEDAYNDKSSP